MIVEVIILGVVTILLAVAWVNEVRFRVKAQHERDEALQGWREAQRLHEEDRETFVGQKGAKEEWPEEIA